MKIIFDKAYRNWGATETQNRRKKLRLVRVGFAAVIAFSTRERMMQHSIQAMRRRLSEPTLFFSFAVFWIFAPMLSASSEERRNAPSGGEPSESVEISITDGWIEPPESPVRRGSVRINVEGTGHVLLHEIKCADGSVGRVVFPRKDKDPRVHDEDDLEVKAPGLNLWPSTTMNISQIFYHDIGHLVFVRGTSSMPISAEPLVCRFGFKDYGAVETPLWHIQSIEDLVKF